MSLTHIIGWDLGGAHLKAALIDENRTVQKVWQLPCPLWKGPQFLEDSVKTIVGDLGVEVTHVITMSGELVDFFDDRVSGVRAIIDSMNRLLSKESLIFKGNSGFVPSLISLKDNDCEEIASANWLASSSWIARNIAAGLFVDIGSTTTDILLLENQAVCLQGVTDFERLSTGELVYTGVVRTPLMALTDKISFENRNVNLMAEWFATTSDVYRMTGELPKDADLMPTADGRSKSRQDSARRIARMIGRDLHSASVSSWEQLARNFRQKQVDRIEAACREQLNRLPELTASAVKLVGAGAGQFLLPTLATSLGCEFVSFDEFMHLPAKALAFSPGVCAPAVSVALLAIDCAAA